MTTEANKALVRRYQEILNENRLDELDQVLAADLRTPDILPGLPSGIEGAKAVHRMMLAGVPDFRTTIDDMIAEGGKVAARITMSGTHTGDVMGIPASGNKLNFPGMYFVTIFNGKIVEHRGVEDSTALLQQLGGLKT